jgi:hypothetical protein
MFLVVVASAACAVVGTAWLHSTPVMGPDRHSHLSLNMAMARAFCGAPWSYSPDYDLAQQLYTNQPARDVPLTQVAASAAGSVGRYCDSLEPYRNQFQPFVTNEALLMLVESALLRGDGGLSLDALGRWLQVIRLVLIAFFALALLRSGASVVLVTILTAIALDALRTLQASFHFAVYPLILPLVLALVGLYALARPWAGRSIRGAALAGGLQGLAAAALVNLRTEYFPFVCALHACFVVAVLWRPDTGSPAPARLAAALAVPFAVAYLGFQAMVVQSPRDAGANYAYHSVSHPLVLSLALPTNGFATARGINWDDPIGVGLARQIDPSATFADTSYETALFKFYRQLWRQHPGEMLDVYRAKARLAGPDAIAQLRAGSAWSPLVRGLMAPYVFLSNGLQFLIVLMVAGVAALWMHLARSWPAGLPLAMICLVAALGQAESLVIMPFFYAQHHAPLLLGLAAVPLAAVQILMDAVLRPRAGH